MKNFDVKKLNPFLKYTDDQVFWAAVAVWVVALIIELITGWIIFDLIRYLAVFLATYTIGRQHGKRWLAVQISEHGGKVSSK